MADIQEYIEDTEAVKEYYANLLILQYRNKPKARATVKLVANLFLCGGLLFQLEDILDIDTAIGAQLDIIGKILGAPRIVQGLTLDKEYFSFEKENALGYSTAQNISKGLFKTYFNSALSKYSLLDEDYRTLLKFKAIVNLWRASMADMDRALYDAFNGDVILVNNHNLTITYIIADKLNIPLQAALKLGYLRAPIGIGFNYIVQVPNPAQVFGFNRYGLKTGRTGFSTAKKVQKGTFLTSNNLMFIN